MSSSTQAAHLPTLHLPESTWRAHESRHRDRVAVQAEAFVQRRAAGEKHPVWDFLFTYYTFSPNKLLTWIPGLHQTFDACPASGLPAITHTWPAPKKRDLDQARWIAALCRNIEQRPARFSCHGLHEWAMVYRQSPEQIRHAGYQLRLSPADMETLVESQSLACTHYDAFRFFTPQAAPRNLLCPTLDTRLENEQGGCLHANMDLYKWAAKLWPWSGSDLVADAFELALSARAMDMRASPYDLRQLGFEPIPIETESGRQQYRQEQQQLASRAAPIRQQLRQAALLILS